MTDKELERLWRHVDLVKFWRQVVEAKAGAHEAYRQARAKAKGGLI